MQTVGKHHVVHTFDAGHAPVLRVLPGEVFVMETNDRFRDWTDGSIWPEQLSVMTGPVFVEGAQPGQMLAIDLLDIRPSLGFGYVITIPGYGVFKDQVEFRKRVVPIEGNRIRYSDTITLPFVPNVSKIGLAPAHGSLPSSAVGAFGGQLSNSQLGPGATVYLPVAVAGGLLTLEDVHAKMSDGEVAASAVEIAAYVTLRCRIADELKLTHPLVITQQEVITMGDGASVEEAAEMAVERLARLLVDRLHLDMTEVAMLLSTAADVRISEMGGSCRHVRAAIPRALVRL